MDFNQDKICEFIVLANGTSIENPVKQTTQTQKQPVVTPIPIEGKCLGFQNNYWRNLLLDNGTVVANPNFVKGVWAASGQYGGSTQPGPSKEQAAQIEDEDDDSGSGGSTEGDEEDEDEESGDEGGCDEHDDYCDESEGCNRADVDCIDDRGFDEDDYNG